MKQLAIQGEDGGIQETHAFMMGKQQVVRIHLYFGTKGRADLTNKAESVMDLLVDMGVLPDDSWLVVDDLRLTGRYRKGAPGALIRITPRGQTKQDVSKVPERTKVHKAKSAGRK